MGRFGRRQPQTDVLRAEGDVEGLVSALAHDDAAVRTKALEALVELAIEAPVVSKALLKPMMPQAAEAANRLLLRNTRALVALERHVRQEAVSRLRVMLEECDESSGGMREALVAEALIGLDAVDAVLAYYDTRVAASVDGSSRAGLFMLEVVKLLTCYAMSVRDRDLLNKLLLSGWFDYKESSEEPWFCFPHLESRMGRPVSEATNVLREIGNEEDLRRLEDQAESQAVKQWARKSLGVTLEGAAGLMRLVETGAFDEGVVLGLIPASSNDDLDYLAGRPEKEIRDAAREELERRGVR